MKKVGFVIPGIGKKWLGGYNYYKNLVAAVNKTDRYLPILICPADSFEETKRLFPNFQVFGTTIIQRDAPLNILGRILFRLLGRDLVFEIYLRRLDVCLLSHGPVLGKYSRVPSLFWMPDFQHLHLPAYFSPDEIRKKRDTLVRVSRNATGLIVSSQSARADALRQEPNLEGKIHVLRFAPEINDLDFGPLSDIVEKYKLPDKYLFLPNQFWAHKNHQLIIEALAKVIKKVPDITVVCTGLTEDYRNPQHFLSLSRLISGFVLEKSFRILGVVSYRDMLCLMYHCHAVINPSKFEGWSTTVEEAKLMGKRLLVSDLGVHREQAEGIGNVSFFSPTDVDDCASVLLACWMESRILARDNISGLSGDLQRAFGSAFSDIADAVLLSRDQC